MSTLLPVLYSETPQNHLCGVCPKPGSCCHDFYLFNDQLSGSYWEEEWPEKAQHEMDIRDLPFVPLRLVLIETDPKSGKRYGVGKFTCPKLTVEGRCSIYATRPITCSTYQAGSSDLCCFIKPNRQET